MPKDELPHCKSHADLCSFMLCTASMCFGVITDFGRPLQYLSMTDALQTNCTIFSDDASLPKVEQSDSMHFCRVITLLKS